MFISKLFIAAGSTYFSASTSSDKDYQKKLCNGSKPLTQNIRDSFPRVISIIDVAVFFNEHIKCDQLRELMSTFAIPISVAQNNELFSKALAAQFNLFIQSGENNIDDIVAMEYQRLLAEPETLVQPMKPLYPNDSAYVCEFKPQRAYAVKTYERFQHIWVIKNIGKQTWRGRKLVFANHTEVRPRADNNAIAIPDTLPGKDIKIATGFDARGFEGKFDCIWEMHDTDGNNCFPNDKNLFCVTITVKFTNE